MIRRDVSLDELIIRGMANDCPQLDVSTHRAAVAFLAPRPTLRTLSIYRVQNLSGKLIDRPDARDLLAALLSVWSYAWRIGLVSDEPPSLDKLLHFYPTREEIAARAAIVRAEREQLGIVVNDVDEPI